MKVDLAQYDVGIIVGRFQVDKLHEGHRELIDWVCQHHSKVIIFLGASPIYGSINNPLDIHARTQMIRESYPNILINYIYDRRSNEEWSKVLDTSINEMVHPNQSVILYGARNSFIRYYQGGFPTQSLVGTKHEWSGTQIRERIKNEVSPSSDFRAGVIYSSYARYPQIIPTVDVIVRNNKGEVALAKKPGEEQWRFPGGFASEPLSYEADARREVQEELNIDITDPRYLISFIVDDWRFRGELDSIKTLVFEAKYFSGKLEGKDDVKEAEWFKLTKHNRDIVVPEHQPIVDVYLSIIEE